MTRASPLPRATSARALGRFRIWAWLARGRRADVWGAELEGRAVALRVSRDPDQRARFDEEQRQSYEAGGLTGRVLEEGAVEPLIRGDALDELIEGAERNGPVESDDLVAVAQGVLEALESLPRGHGDLIPAHQLIAEDGALHLIDAAPAAFALAPSLPGREVLAERPPDARASDCWALRETLRGLWFGARLPDERPPGWVEQLGKVESMDQARALVPSGALAGPAARARRARLLSRLCPERRRAWEQLTGAARESSRPMSGVLESAFSHEPTRVDVAQLSFDPAFSGLSGDLQLETRGVPTTDSAPPLVGGAIEPPSLGLSKESLVPTQVVRERGRGAEPAAARLMTPTPAPTSARPGAGPPPTRPGPTPAAQSAAPASARPSGSGAPPAAAAPAGFPTPVAAPESLRAPISAEPSPAVGEDEDDGLVLPVPDDELETRRARGMAVVLGVAALGITVVVSLLALGQFPVP